VAKQNNGLSIWRRWYDRIRELALIQSRQEEEEEEIW